MLCFLITQFLKNVYEWKKKEKFNRISMDKIRRDGLDGNVVLKWLHYYDNKYSWNHAIHYRIFKEIQ